MNLNKLIPVGTTTVVSCGADSYSSWFEVLRPQEEIMMEKCVFDRQPGMVGHSASVYKNDNQTGPAEYHVLVVVHTMQADVPLYSGDMSWKITNIGTAETVGEALMLMTEYFKTIL